MHQLHVSFGFYLDLIFGVETGKQPDSTCGSEPKALLSLALAFTHACARALACAFAHAARARASARGGRGRLSCGGKNVTNKLGLQSHTRV